MTFAKLRGGEDCSSISRVFYNIFIRGEIIVHFSLLKLGGSGGMLPQENFVIYNL